MERPSGVECLNHLSNASGSSGNHSNASGGAAQPSTTSPPREFQGEREKEKMSLRKGRKETSFERSTLSSRARVTAATARAPRPSIPPTAPAPSGQRKPTTGNRGKEVEGTLSISDVNKALASTIKSVCLSSEEVATSPKEAESITSSREKKGSLAWNRASNGITASNSTSQARGSHNRSRLAAQTSKSRNSDTPPHMTLCQKARESSTTSSASGTASGARWGRGKPSLEKTRNAAAEADEVVPAVRLKQETVSSRNKTAASASGSRQPRWDGLEEKKCTKVKVREKDDGARGRSGGTKHKAEGVVSGKLDTAKGVDGVALNVAESGDPGDKNLKKHAETLSPVDKVTPKPAAPSSGPTVVPAVSHERNRQDSTADVVFTKENSKLDIVSGDLKNPDEVKLVAQPTQEKEPLMNSLESLRSDSSLPFPLVTGVDPRLCRTDPEPTFKDQQVPQQRDDAVELASINSHPLSASAASRGCDVASVSRAGAPLAWSWNFRAAAKIGSSCSESEDNNPEDDGDGDTDYFEDSGGGGCVNRDSSKWSQATQFNNGNFVLRKRAESSALPGMNWSRYEFIDTTSSTWGTRHRQVSKAEYSGKCSIDELQLLSADFDGVTSNNAGMYPRQSNLGDGLKSRCRTRGSIASHSTCSHLSNTGGISNVSGTISTIGSGATTGSGALQPPRSAMGSATVGPIRRAGSMLAWSNPPNSVTGSNRSVSPEGVSTKSQRSVGGDDHLCYDGDLGSSYGGCRESGASTPQSVYRLQSSTQVNMKSRKRIDRKAPQAKSTIDNAGSVTRTTGILSNAARSIGAEGESALKCATAFGEEIKQTQAVNEQLGRILRISQGTAMAGGSNCIHTAIEVTDLHISGEEPIFSVKHTHAGRFDRQMAVHKNILFACKLAGIAQPPIPIPVDSRKMFEQTDSAKHIHAYIERILYHFHTDIISPDLSLYWWRIIDNGVAVLQNNATGKMVIMRNQERTLTSAIRCVVRMAQSMRMLGDSFFEKDANFPTLDTVAAERRADASLMISPEQVEDVVCMRWASEDGVEASSTRFLIKMLTCPSKSQAQITLRYSIGISSDNPAMLIIQAHSSGSLAKESRAHIVCMAPIVAETLSVFDLRFAYLKALWFLKKLHRLHVATLETTQAPGKGNPPEAWGQSLLECKSDSRPCFNLFTSRTRSGDQTSGERGAEGHALQRQGTSSSARLDSIHSIAQLQLDRSGGGLIKEGFDRGGVVTECVSRSESPQISVVTCSRRNSSLPEGICNAISPTVNADGTSCSNNHFPGAGAQAGTLSPRCQADPRDGGGGPGRSLPRFMAGTASCGGAAVVGSSTLKQSASRANQRPPAGNTRDLASIRTPGRFLRTNTGSPTVLQQRSKTAYAGDLTKVPAAARRLRVGEACGPLTPRNGLQEADGADASPRYSKRPGFTAEQVEYPLETVGETVEFSGEEAATAPSEPTVTNNAQQRGGGDQVTGLSDESQNHGKDQEKSEAALRNPITANRRAPRLTLELGALRDLPLPPSSKLSYREKSVPPTPGASPPSFMSEVRRRNSVVGGKTRSRIAPAPAPQIGNDYTSELDLLEEVENDPPVSTLDTPRATRSKESPEEPDSLQLLPKAARGGPVAQLQQPSGQNLSKRKGSPNQRQRFSERNAPLF